MFESDWILIGCAVALLFSFTEAGCGCVSSCSQRERQTQKEEAHVLTEKLDQEWKSIQNLLAHKTPRAERTDEADKPKVPPDP